MNINQTFRALVGGKRYSAVPWCLLLNLLWVYLCYGICRVAFFLENRDLFQDPLTGKTVWDWLVGGFIFDTSAIAYTNGLYLLLVLLPFHWKETPQFRRVTKWVFVTVNALCLVANLMDTVYFPFRQTRTTATVFDEFKNETNLLEIFGVELFRHWYFVLLAAGMILFLVGCYRHARPLDAGRSLWRYYLSRILWLTVFVLLTIFGMRGCTFTTATRPISINDAHQYVRRPIETGIVLNTPFAILRTLRTKPLDTPTYFEDSTQLDLLYSPLHIPADTLPVRKKNVVILIVESFGREYIGSLNTHLDNGTYAGYTPFTDSLLKRSLSFSGTFSNSGFSIDAMPAVLASIPRMNKPYVVTPFSLNRLNSLATELKNWGYYTAFFHGAENKSMGLQAFARSIGFDDYFGRTEYGEDPRFRGDEDFDGTWAIWDEPYLQHFCLRMNDMKEPFFTSVFTASSHHPFAIPDQYRDTFPDEGLYPLHKCIRYTDHALRRFFETASRQPWYKNTIFVLTADHGSSRTTHAEYKTSLGQYRIPILFFDPSGEMPTGCRDGIAQQIDIMPTLLGYLGYDRPYIAFGQDLLHTAPEDTWAMNWVQVPQYIRGNYLIRFDLHEVTGVYAYRTDPLLHYNLKNEIQEQELYTTHLKAILQSYRERMEADNLTVPR